MNEAIPYLHAKLVTAAPTHLSNLGLMSREDVREKVLVNKFSVKETHAAIDHCVNNGVMDKYYIVPCRHCGQKSHILESDPASDTKLSEITSVGYSCRHCQEFQKAVKPVTQRFAIAQSVLTDGTDDGEYEPAFVAWLKSLINFLLFWRRDDK